MAERAVSFTRVFNFRDLGGYANTDGQTVRWQRLFRSDDLSRLSEDDREQFAALGIRTVIDLRRPREIELEGRIPDLHPFEYRNIHLPHPEWPAAEFNDSADRARYVLERYREMSVFSGPGLGEALRLISDTETAPVVVHCIAGKDRTGIVSALTLALLGVPDDVIADDYQLSDLAEPQGWEYLNRYRPDMATKRWSQISVSPREGMLLFLEDLRRRHGSVRGFTASVGVSDDHVAALRAHLLQPPGSRS
jgi:hypothetical protein